MVQTESRSVNSEASLPEINDFTRYVKYPRYHTTRKTTSAGDGDAIVCRSATSELEYDLAIKSVYLQLYCVECIIVCY